MERLERTEEPGRGGQGREEKLRNRVKKSERESWGKIKMGVVLREKLSTAGGTEDRAYSNRLSDCLQAILHLCNHFKH